MKYTISYKLHHSNAGFLGIYSQNIHAESKSDARKKCREYLKRKCPNIGGIYTFNIGKAIPA